MRERAADAVVSNYCDFWLQKRVTKTVLDRYMCAELSALRRQAKPAIFDAPRCQQPGHP